MTSSEKQAMKIRKHNYWKSIKVNPESHAKYKEKRTSRRIKREALIRANPELEELRKRKKRENMRAYRALCKSKENK